MVFPCFTSIAVKVVSLLAYGSHFSIPPPYAIGPKDRAVENSGHLVEKSTPSELQTIATSV
jgi:hypothetical protein